MGSARAGREAFCNIGVVQEVIRYASPLKTADSIANIFTGVGDSGDLEEFSFSAIWTALQLTLKDAGLANGAKLVGRASWTAQGIGLAWDLACPD
jgi:hypothetical protein